MEKALFRFKGTLLVVLLMLIATRLTWLQTSETPAEISSTFYRTGLWASQTLQKHCSVLPEATYPIPASMAIQPEESPPSPENGEISPGLAAVMFARCQFARLGVEDFARWNAWLYTAATLFSALAARLLTSSWTAGLLAAVAVLSRGTVQSQSMFVTAEPFAAVFLSAGWCLFVLFLRSMWKSWLFLGLLSFALASLFLPSLWWILALSSVIPLFVISKPTDLPILKEKSTPSEAILFSLLLIFMASVFSYLLVKFSRIELPFFALGHLEGWRLSISQIVHSRTLLAKLDNHTVLAMFLLFSQIWPKGRLGGINKIGASIFLLSIAVQVTMTIITTQTAEKSDILIEANLMRFAKSLEPIYFAWSTACAWRILDWFSGFRFSNSGWSIRRRGKIIE